MDLNVLQAIALTSGRRGDNFGATIAMGDLDGNGKDDLVIGAPNDNRVYVVYDGIFGATNGEIDLSKGAYEFDVISGNGGGVGSNIELLDFDDDGDLDIALGSPFANPLTQDGINKGYGGLVYLVKGKTGRLGKVELSQLNGSNGIVFKGEARISPGFTDDANGAIPDYAYVDQVGAVAAVDINGDGVKDLAIGAPSASFAQNTQVGRTYILFGGRQWSTRTSEYPLIDLYNSKATQGLILEGSVASGGAGQTLAVGGDINQDKQADLLISAPFSYASAGESYVFFGSSNRYAGLGENRNVFSLNVNTQDPRVATYQGIVNPLTANNPINNGLVGMALAGVGDLNVDGVSDFLIGAPTSQVNGSSQTYTVLGHPWVNPGTAMNVSDLRSDNGFVTEVGGQPFGIGDFNLDGYDDFLVAVYNRQTQSTTPKLILGASTLSNLNGQREFVLDKLSIKVTEFNQALPLVSSGDYNNDGYQDLVTVASDQILTLVSGGDNISAQIASPTNRFKLGFGGNFTLTSGDIDGDGYSDLLTINNVGVIEVFFGSNAGLAADESTIVDLTDFYPQAELYPSYSNRGFYIQAVDLNGDSKDELVVFNVYFENGNQVKAQIKVFSYPDRGLDQFIELARQILVNPAFPSKQAYVGTYPYYPQVVARLSTGDFDGDGYQDILSDYILKGYSLKDEFLYTTNVLFGRSDLSQRLKQVAIAQDNSKEQNLNAGSFSTSIGDVNADGYDDILVGQTFPRKYNYVILGNSQLTSLPGGSIIFIPSENKTSFEYGFVVEGLNSVNKPYLSGEGGDLNGDGFDDWLMSNIDGQSINGNLTYGVYGNNFIPRNPLDRNTILDREGTIGNDVIKQYGSGGKNIVRINGKDGDDFIQIVQPANDQFKVYINGGAGNDRIGISAVNNQFIYRLTGASGQDTLFLDITQPNSQRVLDLSLVSSLVSSIEVVELNPGDSVIFQGGDIAAISDIKTLIVKGGMGSTARPIQEDVEWYKVGENGYEGAVYEVYEYGGGKASVWIEKGAVSWQPIPVTKLASVNQKVMVHNDFSFELPEAILDNSEKLTVSVQQQDNGLLPSWLTFDTETHTLYGKPREANLGNLNLKFTLIDDEQIGELPLSIQIEDNPQLSKEALISPLTNPSEQIPLFIPTNVAGRFSKAVAQEPVVRANNFEAFTLGAFDLEVIGVTEGGYTRVEVLLPANSNINDYLNSVDDNWQSFSFDGDTGLEFSDLNQDGIEDLVLHLRDGARGDSDGLVNGLIQVPGAAALNTPGLNTRDGVFRANTLADTHLQARWVSGNARNDYEFGWLAVDDFRGGFDTNQDNLVDLLPKDPDYAAYALSRKQMIFQGQSKASSLSLTRESVADDFSRSELQPIGQLQDFTVTKGFNIFYLTQNGETIFSVNNDYFQAQTDGQGYHQLAFAQPEAPAVKFEIGSSTLVTPGIVGEKVTTSVELKRVGSLTSTLGVYPVDDLMGGLDTDGDGTIDLLTGQPGYAKAALERSRSLPAFTTPDYKGVSQSVVELESAQLFGLFIIPNASVEAFLSQNPQNTPSGGRKTPLAYFSFAEANPDSLSHMIRLGSAGENIFGFEDLFGGGDRDFNDLIVQFDFA